MRMKKFFSVFCALAVLLSLFAGVTDGVYAEDDTAIVSLTAAEQQLSTPQNLREEDGYLVWDIVEEAYGYYLNIRKANYEQQLTYYVCTAEVDRLCYENKMDFGEYTFQVCAFKEDGTISEWSSQITVTYAPVLTAPTNVRIDPDDNSCIVWDRVDGVPYYNIRFYNDDAERTLYNVSYGNYNYNSFGLWDNGNFWCSIQLMDRDYNVSPWTEPIMVSYTQEEETFVTIQNLRFDETGEKILWDEMEGAASYDVAFYYSDGNIDYIYNDQAELDNWKVFVRPWFKEYRIGISAVTDEAWASSEQLTASFNWVLDDTINMPKDLSVGSEEIHWDTSKDVQAYWMEIYTNGQKIDEDHWFLKDEHWDTEGYSTVITKSVDNEYPEGSYNIKLFAVSENGKYNVKTYSVTIDTPHDKSVWVPEVFYKFDTLLWDYDQIRHDETWFFWVRIKNAKDGSIVMLDRIWGGYFYDLYALPNGEYTFETCAYEHTGKLGPWSTPLKILKHDGGLFDKENEVTTEVETPSEAVDIPESDRVTSITINPAFNLKHKDGNNVELDLTKIKIKAKEIYDEEGLKRAAEALGEEIAGNKHYNLLDLTLLYNGEDFSNGYEGLVQVIIPIPAGHRDKTFSCYRLTEVNGKMTKELIPGEQTEDSYIIYLEHFSLYALVADGGEGKESTPTEPSESIVPSTPPVRTTPSTGDKSGIGFANSDTNGNVIVPNTLTALGSFSLSSNINDVSVTGIVTILICLVALAGVVIVIYKQRK